MKNLIAIAAFVILSAAVLILVFLPEDAPRQTPADPGQTAAMSERNDGRSETETDATPTAPQVQTARIEKLLATLYASSKLDALLAGALISQHLLNPQQEDLYGSYGPQEFFGLALSLNARDPIVLFAVSNYCLSDAESDGFCQESRYLQAFSEVSGNNATSWAMRATEAYRSGNFQVIPDLLNKTGQAILLTDYWPEVVLILLRAFQETGYAPGLQQAYSAAFEVAPGSFQFYRDLLAMCGEASRADNSQWLTGCQSLGRIMQQSGSLITTSIGIGIENSANQLLGMDPSLLREQSAEISHLSALLTQITQQAQSDPESLQLYLDDLGKFGEKVSLLFA
jgi:hypothetical protein